MPGYSMALACGNTFTHRLGGSSRKAMQIVDVGCIVTLRFVNGGLRFQYRFVSRLCHCVFDCGRNSLHCTSFKSMWSFTRFGTICVICKECIPCHMRSCRVHVLCVHSQSHWVTACAISAFAAGPHISQIMDDS